jgi:hypothetical protein
MIVEPLNNCSSILSAEGNPVTTGVSLRCSDFGVALAALPLSVALCFLMASKTLPIVSPLIGALTPKALIQPFACMTPSVLIGALTPKALANFSPRLELATTLG